MDSTTKLRLILDRLWDGSIANEGEWAEVTMTLSPAGLSVGVTASFHDDPAPEQTPGPTDELWNYEVVELFVANESGEYLELELGPHGHYLALLFSGVREVERRDVVIDCRATINGALWKATAHVDQIYLPHGISRANAYAIHGQGGARRFLAAYPVPGERPDFHQPHRFRLFEEIPGATPPVSGNDRSS